MIWFQSYMLSRTFHVSLYMLNRMITLQTMVFHRDRSLGPKSFTMYAQLFTTKISSLRTTVSYRWHTNFTTYLILVSRVKLLLSFLNFLCVLMKYEPGWQETNSNLIILLTTCIAWITQKSPFDVQVYYSHRKSRILASYLTVKWQCHLT